VNLPPGYTSRPATRDDLEAIVDLVHAVDLADVGLQDPVRDELLWDWSTPGFRIERDSRVAVGDDGRLVGYADVIAHDPSVQIRSWLQVHPDHREGGLSSAFADWIGAHANSLLPTDAGDVPLRYGVSATDRGTTDLLSGLGFAHARSFLQMMRPLSGDRPRPTPVDGVRLRASMPGRDDRAVFEVLDGAFRENFGYEPYTFAEWSEQWFGDSAYDPGLVFLASDGERAVGACQAIVLEGTGWVTELGVLKPWRRRGIGRALLQRTFAELQRRGIDEVRLGVDAENADGAMHLYESVGMSVRREWHVYEKRISAG
jgi:mycothiol synthase